MRFPFIWVFLLVSGSVAAQSTYLPLNTNGYQYLDRLQIKTGQLATGLHTSLKPWSRREIAAYAESYNSISPGISSVDRFNLYYLFKENNEWSPTGEIDSKKPILKHFYRSPSDLYELRTNEFLLKINPVLNQQYMNEMGNPDADTFTIWPMNVNTRGLEVRGMINKKVGFYTYFTDNQAFYPKYVQQRIDSFKAVPGEGFYKDLVDSNKKTGVDHLTARGYIALNATKNISMAFGYDKHFIGNGIRSLLLSDFSNSNLFLRINTNIWKINYQNLFTELTEQEFSRGADTLLSKKYGSFHHLSMNVAKWLNIGIFESIIYSRKGHIELQYLNPIILFRLVEHNLGSPDNVIVGVDWNALFLKHFAFYGQLMLDEFLFSAIKSGSGWWANKYGLQLGVKYVDVAGVSNLDMQGEANLVRPYSYTHRGKGNANYSHYNQPLAHPLGANFYEVLGITNYQPHPKINIQGRLGVYIIGRDTTGTNWGGDILTDYGSREMDFGNRIAQGLRSNILFAELWLTYQWKHNIFFDLKFGERRERSTITRFERKAAFLTVAFRTNIADRRFDF